jgi:hypothetical protein
MDYWRTYYAMKQRRGGEKLTVRDKMFMHHLHLCPGCNAHRAIVGERRGEIIFKRYVGGGNKLYTMYWRSHMSEYAEILASFKRKAV